MTDAGFQWWFCLVFFFSLADYNLPAYFAFIELSSSTFDCRDFQYLHKFFLFIILSSAVCRWSQAEIAQFIFCLFISLLFTIQQMKCGQSLDSLSTTKLTT